jgi:hypothetical protein
MDRSRLAAIAAVALAAGCHRYYLVDESVLATAQARAKQEPEHVVAVPAVRQEDHSRVVFTYAAELVRDDSHRAHALNTWWVGTAFLWGLSGAGLAVTVGLLIDAKLCTGLLCSFGPDLGAAIVGGVSGLFLLAGIATAIVAAGAHPAELKSGQSGVVYVGPDGVIRF